MADVFACLFRSLSVVSEDIDLVPNKKKAKKSHTKDKPSNGSVYTPASVKRRKIQDEDFDAESSSSSCSSSASSSKSSSLPTFPSPVSAPSRSKAIETSTTPNKPITTASKSSTPVTGHVVFDEEGNVKVIEEEGEDGPVLHVLPPWMRQRPPHKNKNYKQIEKKLSRRDKRREKAKQAKAARRLSQGDVGVGVDPSGPSATSIDETQYITQQPEATLQDSPSYIDQAEGLPPLEGKPQPGDVLVFKMWEVSSRWQPELSEWKRGAVLSFNAATEVLQVEVSVQSEEANVKVDIVEYEEEGERWMDEGGEDDGDLNSFTRKLFGDSALQPRIIEEPLASFVDVRLAFRSTEAAPI